MTDYVMGLTSEPEGVYEPQDYEPDHDVDYEDSERAEHIDKWLRYLKERRETQLRRGIG